MAIDEHSRARGASESEAVRSRKKRRKRNKVVFVIEIIVLILVLAAFGVWIFLHNKMEKMQTLPPEETFEEEEVKVNEDLPEQVVEASEDYTMFMIFGVDARNNSDLLKNANADTDMICSINNETGEIKLVSILRDTFVETSTGKWTKLTDVYAGYGVQEALQTINRNFDLNITKYVSVNWKSVAQVVDLLGGIDVELSSAEVNFINNNMQSVTDVIGISS